MTGGPPDMAPMLRTPANAVHELTTLKQNPIILKRLKLRLSSGSSLVLDSTDAWLIPN